MPEVITRHPDSLIMVLKSAGATCGKGAKQQILTKCPPDQFCALPKGEICVYGFNSNLSTMTQMTVDDFAAISSHAPTIYSGFNIILLIIACLFGMFFGMKLRKK